jgi:phosphoribosylamine--glycine ligase
MEEARNVVILPTLRAMAAEGSPFKGLLYAGLMQTADGIKVVEFNCRFGDPETQVVLPMMEGSLLEPMLAVARGSLLHSGFAPARSGAAVSTVVASGGYPGSYEKGKPITLPSDLESDDLVVFHAGTKPSEEGLLTSGGRVLAVTSVAATLAEASTNSRAGANAIEFEGAFHRNDIGWRELERRGER